MGSTLSRDEARAYYDWFGSKQDTQAFYEDPATRDLIAHAEFESAKAVFELGCGTGRFAAELLSSHLPPEARYAGCDLSATMVGLARDRLAKFGGRAEVQQTDGAPRLVGTDGSFDRFVSNFVLDLLPREDAETMLREAHRLLADDGRLCLVSLTHGVTNLSHAVTWVWTRLYRARPSLVGGCRPIELCELLPEGDWRIAYRHVVVSFGIPSEVVVAHKLSPDSGGR